MAWPSRPTWRRTGPAVDGAGRGRAPAPCRPIDRHQAGAGAQQRGLAGAVRALEQDDLAGRHVEIDAGQGGEATEERDGAAEVDDGLHGDVANGTGAPIRRQCGAGGRRIRGGRPRTLPHHARPRSRRGRTTLITVGVLILLFVVYQLWGTNLQEARPQRHLNKEFNAQLEPADTADTPTTPTTTCRRPPARRSTVPRTTPPKLAPANLPLPSRRADRPDPDPEDRRQQDRRRGRRARPAQAGARPLPETPLPGQEGNAAIAGHRTTYGAPFNRIDELKPGDEIIDHDPAGHVPLQGRLEADRRARQTWRSWQDKGDNRLTLTRATRSTRPASASW